MPFCAKWLMITALELRINFNWIVFTCFLLSSSSTASYFTNLRSGFPMGLPLGLSLSFKLHSAFNIMLLFPVSTYCFCFVILLTLSSRLLLPHRYHLPIRVITTSFFLVFFYDIHIISSINGIHHSVAIPLHGSFYI